MHDVYETVSRTMYRLNVLLQHVVTSRLHMCYHSDSLSSSLVSAELDRSDAAAQSDTSSFSFLNEPIRVEQNQNFDVLVRVRGIK